VVADAVRIERVTTPEISLLSPATTLVSSPPKTEHPQDIALEQCLLDDARKLQEVLSACLPPASTPSLLV
jgi:hypothetical protein